MLISLIVAMDEQGGIGLQNRLPWHLSTDLKRFKALTMGHHILMGRRTFESIDRSLPGRTMIVVSQREGYRLEGGYVVHSIQDGLDLAERREESEVFCIGGGQIFAQTIGLADRIYMTLVHTIAGCDVFFPDYDEAAWQEIDVSHHPVSAQDDFNFTFKTLVQRVDYS